MEGLSRLSGTPFTLVEPGAGVSGLPEGFDVLVRSAVHYKTAAIVDIAAEEREAARLRKTIIWDLSHAAGLVDLKLERDGAKYAVGCGYKYLNGGPGAPAFVYCHRDVVEGFAQPLSGWMGHAPGLALRDYHAENLIWLPDREIDSRTGLLDFQDALFAHPAYDLVSLIEDARRDVAPDLAEPLKARFCKAAGLTDRAAFDAAYAVLGAQRNAKILGIFVRLAKRDGKARYLDLIPRVQAHFARDLAHPALRDVASLVRTMLAAGKG